MATVKGFNIVSRHFVSIALAGVLTLMTASVSAQILTAQMHDVDFSGLRRVKLKICADVDGLPIAGLDTSNFTLTENGVRQYLRLRCSEPGTNNSVVLVLDNSGSMSPVMPKLIEAASRLVDSLGSGDECEIISFGRTITVKQDFTTDKLQLKTVLNGLVANGGTPLFDASLLGVQLVGQQLGNRNVVIITDGEDNTSTSNENDVIAQAKTFGVKLYTIAFNIEVKNQKILEKMALSTGGSFFVVERPSELTAVYERIAAEITEKCCLAEYESTSCSDTLRTLVLTTDYQGMNTVDRQTFTTPARPPHTNLVLDLPEELMPLSDGTGYVLMIPAPSPALELSLAFTLVYDPDLVDVTPPLPYTLGTVAQNQIVDISKTAPGEMRFLFNRIEPAISTPLLVGFPVHAHLADSSRRVRFTIKDIQLEGCPTEFSVIDDSVTICQCVQRLQAKIDTVIVIGVNATAEIPVRIDGGLMLTSGLLGSLQLQLPENLDLLDIQPGSLFPDAATQWTRLPDRTVEISIPVSAVPLDTAGTLVVLHVQARTERTAQISELHVLQSRFWQQCCLSAGPSVVLMIQDGACERVLIGSNSPRITTSPNPVTCVARTTVIHVSIPASAPEEHYSLRVMDAQGREIAELNNGTLAAGPHSFVFDANGLPAGRYFVVLQSPQTIVTGTIVYTP